MQVAVKMGLAASSPTEAEAAGLSQRQQNQNASELLQVDAGGSRVSLRPAAANNGHAQEDQGGPSAFAAQKGMRTMGLESLLMLPKLALTQLFLPDDVPPTADPLCGPRVAADRVRMHRSSDEGLSLSAHASCYRAVLLRSSVQGQAFLPEEAHSLSAGGGNPPSREASEAEGAAEAFDFLSIASVAAMDAGIRTRPSWKELALQVGTVQRIRTLCEQLKEELRQIKPKLGDTQSTASEPAAAEDGRTSADAQAERGSRSLSGSQAPLAETASSATAASAAGSRQQTLPCAADGGVRQQTVEQQRSLSASLRGRGRRKLEAAYLLAERMQLEKDIAALERAYLELEALLRRVWRAERLPQDARIDQAAFRQLWCFPEDDEQQADTADRLFLLCCNSVRSRSLGGGSSQGTSSRQSANAHADDSSGSQSGALSFEELLDLLPPKALECLWCSGELRKKERQTYRYFWI
ncbi:hypothetical protein Efla_004149 [Eimeria flavescens]